MKNHRSQSFPEKTLDRWNNIAIFLTETVKSVPSEQRSQTFIQSVMDLSTIANDNQIYRQNLLKGADIVFHGIFHTSENHPVPSERLEKQVQLSRWKRFTIFIRKLTLTILVIILIAGAFVLGKASTQPRITAQNATTSSTAIPKLEDSPEIAIKDFLEAVQKEDISMAMGLFHPNEVKINGRFLIDGTLRLVEDLPRFHEINPSSVVTEETALVMMNFVQQDGKIIPGEFFLRKYQGKWFLVNIDL